MERSRTASFSQADETRFDIYGDTEGTTNGIKPPHRWGGWVLLTLETVVYVIDPSRSSKVPLAPFADRVSTAIVDRDSSDKDAAARIVGFPLAFCWAHTRRDFARVFIKHPAMKPWVATWIAWVRRIYRLGKTSEDRINNRQEPRGSPRPSGLHETEAENDLRRSKSLLLPAQKAIKSLLHPWDGLTLVLKRPEILLDNKSSERALRSQVMGRKSFGGAGAHWLTLIGPSRRLDPYPLRHMDEKRDQHSHRPHRRPHRLRDPGQGPR